MGIKKQDFLKALQALSKKTGMPEEELVKALEEETGIRIRTQRYQAWCPCPPGELRDTTGIYVVFGSECWKYCGSASRYITLPEDFRERVFS